MSDSRPHVAVIGGGCAGLAAAAQLTENRIPVTLFEASPYLGGRARGVSWKGLCLDNGQHILLGAYSETLRLLHLAGTDTNTDFLRIPLRLHMHGELKLSATPGLPAPLHIFFGFLLANGLSVKERIAALRFMTWLKHRSFELPQDQTLSTLLQHQNQPTRLIRLMWEPLCLAALNTPISQASAQVFLNVLRDSFAAKQGDSDMLLPRRDLSSVMANPLADYIARKGGKIRLGAPVTKLNKSRKFEIETQDGDQQLFTHVVLATSPFRLAPLLTGFPQLTNIAELVSQLDYQPIYTVYLQYPENVRLEQP
ncbi:MAG TPA: hydroxysqualene dehydroxylase HpnE, partial [Methylophilaceae bacterium]|nr:hydroxysqualene dehydroxylase HpnE [Methylophilaceae bacterium]